ncbi:MAG: peptidase S41 [Luteitalea sp.]|nr:peptidase S41 [Luteitalea sp.]
MRYFATLFLGAAAVLLVGPGPALAQIDARMFRYPDISATHITFVYAGDIWIVPKEGGVASHLSSPAGEEAFPRFSPDGSHIAFSANYDGNLDVYVVPAMGGDPVRVTHHPAADRLLDWHPDGARVLFASQRESGRQRFNQFFLASAEGGLPEKLPVPYGEFAAFSPDGKELVYLPQSQAFRTWKRYRGGWAPDVWLFNLTSLDAKNISASEAIDEHPMWHGNTIYFVSDRGPRQRHNIWAYDRATGAVRQVTRFDEFDITFPAIGPSDMVFEAGGRLYRLDLETERVAEVAIRVVTDRSTLKTRTVKVGDSITSASVSPTGKRAVFEARGDAFTVPAEHGPVLDVTRSSGVAERYPRWSPDGKTLAYWTDRSGEYELALRLVSGAGEERVVTKLGPGYRYPPHWSPDSTRVAFADEKLQIQLYDVARNEATVIDQSPIFMDNGTLQRLPIHWSADSRWIAWARPDAQTRSEAVFLYDTKTAQRHQVTSGYFQDSSPVFDPEGRYLYFFSNRHFEPVYSDFDNSWTYPNATHIVAVPLRKDVPSPLAARNDAEGEDEAEEDDTDEKKKKEASEQDEADETESEQDEKDATDEKDEKPKPVEIDIEGFEARAVVLPPKPGNYADLFAVNGKVLYRRGPRTGSSDEKSPLVYFDLEEREEKTVLADADGFEPTFDGKKLFVLHEKKYAMVELDEKQKFEKPMRTAEMEAVIDPAAEWRQMFADTYRLERDFFYDPNMHGVDWAAARDRYAKLLDAAVTRWDVNFVLGEFIAELNASHTYRGGGDEQKAPTRGVGMLGADWALENGAYRIAHIVSGGTWSADVRSPLAEPGVDVEQGDYVLAVNGSPLDTAKDPWAAFQGLANETVVLTVNEKPTVDRARRVVVKCLTDETELRFRAWVEERRQRVAEATKGRVGYVYVQSTGRDAQNELIRQFMAAWRKDGLIIDERFNSGGQIPDRFVELLNRPILSHWAVRHGEDWQWPPVAHRGPQVMLINGWSGSGGDAFPFYFREAELGPLIGTRTWGGLIGISGAPGLVDGGTVTVPTFRMYDVKGQWFAEGHGVEPDIEVPEDPSELARGTDPQLERAIAEVLDRIAKQPAAPSRPAYERRVPKPVIETGGR